MTNPLALIIEDDRMLATIFARAVKEAGFNTQIIIDGARAASRLSSVIPELVLLDLHLPKVSGEELFWQIRQDIRLKNTKVIIASADTALAETFQNKADLVLHKPVSFNQIVTVSSEFLSAISTEKPG